MDPSFYQRFDTQLDELRHVQVAREVGGDVLAELFEHLDGVPVFLR